MDHQPVTDLIVILPGILGSTLWRDDGKGGKEQVWGPKGLLVTMLKSGVRPSKISERLTEALRLDDGNDPEAPERMEARLLDGLSIIPGFIGVTGYDKLEAQLRQDFGRSVIAHPYDWRYSNRVTAQLMAQRLAPLIEERRRTHPEAGVIFVTHSMGGLVARWYAEKLDPNGYTKHIITVGTPYSGAVNALIALANGTTRFGPFRLSIGELMRSWSSVSELLPVYRCWQPNPDLRPDSVGPEDLSPLPTDRDIGQLPQALMAHGARFHRQLLDGADPTVNRDRYVPVRNGVQDTNHWAQPDSDGTLAGYGWSADDHPFGRGDGTVPLGSALPPEWGPKATGVDNIVTRHSSMQEAVETIRQASMVIARGAPGVAMSSPLILSAQAPSFSFANQALTVEARTVQGQFQAAEATLYDDADNPIETAVLRQTDIGRYAATVTPPAPGLYRWEVANPTTYVEGQIRFDPVSDVLACGTESS